MDGFKQFNLRAFALKLNVSRFGHGTTYLISNLCDNWKLKGLSTVPFPTLRCHTIENYTYKFIQTVHIFL